MEYDIIFLYDIFAKKIQRNIEVFLSTTIDTQRFAEDKP